MHLPLKQSVVVSTVACLVLVTGAFAVTHSDIAARLGGLNGDLFDLDGGLKVNSLTVGDQGAGGVTFFNGTLINATTDANGKGNPVTIGDDVRVDGVLFNGATGKPVRVQDDLKVTGDVTAHNLYSKTQTDALLDDKMNAADAYTKTQSNSRYYTQSQADSRYVSQSTPLWDAATQDVVLTAGDFTDSNTADGYSADGGDIIPADEEGIIFYGNPHIPNGAVVTGMEVTAKDNNTDSGEAVWVILCREARTVSNPNCSGNSNVVQMANIYSDTAWNESASFVTATSTSITSPTIDTGSYVYHVYLDISDPTDLAFRSVRITYTTTGPSSTVGPS